MGKANNNKNTGKVTSINGTNTITSRFNKVNSNDLRTMFGTLSITMARNDFSDEQIDKKLDEYKKHQVPFWNGDVIEDNEGTRWVIAVVYDDKTCDLITAEGDFKRKNTGVLGYKKVGELEVISC